MEHIKILLIGSNATILQKLDENLTEWKIRDDSVFVEMVPLDVTIVQKVIFDLIIVNSMQSEFSALGIVTALRKKEEENFLTRTPIILSGEFYPCIDLEQVSSVDDIHNFLKLHELILEAVPASIDLSYLYSVAEVAMPEPAVLIGKIVDIFKASAPIKINEIEKLLLSRDFAKASKVAHALRSTSCSVGANALACVLGELEKITRTGASCGSRQYWTMKLKHEFQKADNAFSEIMSKKLYLK
jgi:HPt (histidine-containing phosphotransfer) domain-containing protein